MSDPTFPTDEEIVARWGAALKAAQPAEARYRAMGGPSIVDVVLSIPRPEPGNFHVTFAPKDARP